jgi:hypothetical protein
MSAPTAQDPPGVVVRADAAATKPDHQQDKATGKWKVVLPRKYRDFDIVSVSVMGVDEEGGNLPAGLAACPHTCPGCCALACRTDAYSRTLVYGRNTP